MFGLVWLLAGRPAIAADLYGGGSDLDADLRGLLASPDPEKRRLGIEQLAGLEPRLAAPHLIARLKDGDASVRAKAARALGPAALHDAAALLIGCLSDADGGVRSACAEAIGQYGALPPGLESRAAATLGRALGDNQYEVRMEALRAIERLLHSRLLGLGEAQQLLGPVLLRVEDEHVGVRRAAASVLGQLGPLSLSAELLRRVVVALLGRLSDSARDVRAQALESLTALGAAEAAPAALRLLQDPAEEVRRQALLYLGGVAYGPAVPLIVEAFESGPEGLRGAAAQALSAIAAKPLTSIDAIRALLVALGREEARALARQALLEVGSVAVPPLLARLRQGASGQVEVGALVDLLRDLGVASSEKKPLAAPLRKQVSDELSAELRRGRLPREQVVDALAAQADPANAQLFVGLLFDSEVAVRRHAAAGLKRPGLLDVRAADALIAATRDSDGEVRTQATLLLAELPLAGSGRPLWLPRLVELSRASDLETRLAATQALGRLAEAAGKKPAASVVAALVEANVAAALVAVLGTPGEGLTELRVRRGAALGIGQLVNVVPAQRAQVVTALMTLLRRSHVAAGEGGLVETLTALGNTLRDAPVNTLLPNQGEAVRHLLIDLATSGGDADSSDAALSCEALDVLGALRDPETAGRIARLVDGRHGHRDPLRRMRAASALGNLLSGPAAELSTTTLITALREDGDGRVIAEAAWALGKLPKSSGALSRVGAALRQLLSRRDSGAEPAAQGGFERGVRTNVLAALARLGQADVADAQWLGDGDPGVRANAALLLGALKDRTPGMAARLRNAATTDEDHRVRENAERALRGAFGARDAPERRHFLTMFQMDHDRRPLTETPYRLTLPDGLTRVGLTDRRGVAREEQLPSGNCEVELLHELSR